MNFIEIWKQAKKEIKKTFPDHAYSTWIKPIKFIGFSGEVLSIEVPNQFFYEWIQSHYHKKIQSVILSLYKNTHLYHQLIFARVCLLASRP